MREEIGISFEPVLVKVQVFVVFGHPVPEEMGFFFPGCANGGMGGQPKEEGARTAFGSSRDNDLRDVSIFVPFHGRRIVKLAKDGRGRMSVNGERFNPLI
jgi:hypothetical protein